MKLISILQYEYKHRKWDMLYTSTAPLTMRYTTMEYTSMRYTSTALYFYEENTRAPNKFFKKHFKQKYVNKYF